MGMSATINAPAIESDFTAAVDRPVLRHMPQLDGLRAIAVSMVVWSHSMGKAYNYLFQMGIGTLGVELFFVLSGFLISGILLDISQNAKSNGERRFGWKQFYIRRFLRIFPLYYVVLLLAVLFNASDIRNRWLWHLAYLSNFYFFRGNSFGGADSHFWSLSVEEQFYLVWPSIIFFIPRKTYGITIFLLIIAAPISRAIAGPMHWYTTETHFHLLTPPNLDTLGVGALLAYAERTPRFPRPYLGIGLLSLGISGLLVTCLTTWGVGLKDTFCAFIFGWFVWKSSRGFNGLFGRFLCWSPIAYLGKISYGVYLIHMFVRAVWWWALYSAPIPGYRIFHRLGIPERVYDSGPVTLLVLVVVTLPLAMLSYRFYEGPINNLKRYFPYVKPSVRRGELA
jgi:peptidoglycan/LPS O-acetylase OafA/YrhL